MPMLAREGLLSVGGEQGLYVVFLSYYSQPSLLRMYAEVHETLSHSSIFFTTHVMFVTAVCMYVWIHENGVKELAI